MEYINTIITGGQYEDPTEWVGTNPNCLLCEKEIEFMDEYCEDHQRCDTCGEREVCERDCVNYKTKE